MQLAADDYIIPTHVQCALLRVIMAGQAVYRVADIQQLCLSAEVTEKDLDWGKYVVCQQVTGEVLKCPANSKHDRDGVGYKTLAENSLVFKKIDCLPSSTQAQEPGGYSPPNIYKLVQ